MSDKPAIATKDITEILLDCLGPVSYTHLDVYKRQEYGSQKAAEKALEEKYGEMARHPIVKMSKSLGNVINPDEVVDLSLIHI